MGELDMGRLAKMLEQPAYIAVGFGVLGFQRAQVLRRACQRRVSEGARQVAPVVSQVASQVVSQVNDRLPPEAEELRRAAGDVVTDVTGEARELLKEAAAFGRFALQVLRAPAGRPA
jgi:hypothetical protein